MRIFLLSIQLSVIGLLCAAVTIPALTAVTGLLYLLTTAPDAAVDFGFRLLVHSILASLGIGGATFSAGGGWAVFLIVFSPFFIAVLTNLVCGFLAYYRGWHKKLRRLAIIVNAIALWFYLLPVLFLAGTLIAALFCDTGRVDGDSIVALVAIALFCGMFYAYFAVCLRLLRRMPERPDVGLTLSRIPGWQVGLWAPPALLFTAVVLWFRVPLNWVTILFSAGTFLSVIPFLFNARATNAIALGRGKLYPVIVLCANGAATLLCLIFLPHVGAMLMISTSLLFFALEMVYLKKENVPVSTPE